MTDKRASTPPSPELGQVLLTVVLRALGLTVLLMLTGGTLALALGWPTALGFADLLPLGGLLAVWPPSA